MSFRFNKFGLIILLVVLAVLISGLVSALATTEIAFLQRRQYGLAVHAIDHGITQQPAQTIKDGRLP